MLPKLLLQCLNMLVHIQNWIETHLSYREKDGGILHLLAHILDFLRETDSGSVIVALYTLLDSLHPA